ncbi:hypothetical protein JTB14_001924 [Gonioctena quinquepunctata]|nr:hypothetical protein JTB14_001924 [Gonioctena quinquepunctata]
MTGEAECSRNLLLKRGLFGRLHPIEILFSCNSDIESQYKGVGRAIEKFGGKHILKNQNRKKGEVAMMTHTLGFPDANGDFKQEARWLHYPILSNRANSTDDDDKLLFQSLKTIKARLISDVEQRNRGEQSESWGLYPPACCSFSSRIHPSS